VYLTLFISSSNSVFLIPFELKFHLRKKRKGLLTSVFLYWLETSGLQNSSPSPGLSYPFSPEPFKKYQMLSNGIKGYQKLSKFLFPLFAYQQGGGHYAPLLNLSTPRFGPPSLFNYRHFGPKLKDGQITSVGAALPSPLGIFPRN
jgi:hypothetical protein